MKFNKKLAVLAISLNMALAFNANADTNLISNGDFSSGLAGWDQIVFPGSNISVLNNFGINNVVFSGPGPFNAEISQTLSVAPGGTYNISFNYDVVSGSGGSFTASIDGQTLLNITAGNASGFGSFNQNVTLDNSSKVYLEFGGQGPANSVILNAIPGGISVVNK
jgi:hypothetical protein